MSDDFTILLPIFTIFKRNIRLVSFLNENYQAIGTRMRKFLEIWNQRKARSVEKVGAGSVPNLLQKPES